MRSPGLIRRCSMVWAAVLLLACQGDEDGPRPLGVSPASGSNLADTPIRIRGQRFQLLVHTSYDDPGRSRVDDAFSARLGPHLLKAVTYVGPEDLDAVVQAGLPPGRYDLEVEDPRGRSGTLSDAFTVLGASDASAEALPGDAGPDADGPGPAIDAGPDTTVPPDGPGPGTGVQLLLTDPFGDATPFAFIFKYDDKIYLGPNKSGSGAVRAAPDGSSATKITFSFPADKSGNSSLNKAAAPYPSIGRAGCTANTAQCGPDNEDGRGIFAAGTLNGTEWLVAAGSRSAGDLDYAYMTNDTDAKLDFRYVDLSARLGPQTKGTSAMQVIGNRVYLGFPDTGGKRPYLVALKVAPGTPGLDVNDDNEAEHMGADKMPGLGLSAPMSMIDAIAELNNRVYLFNNGGCIRATVAQPASYETKASDWSACTPTVAAYAARTSLTTTKVSGITPADRAFSQIAVYKGRLYAGRNTTAGPQLLACDPGATGESGQCDPGDWTLIAANTAGSTTLSQFNNPGNTRITLVVATSAYLYVGFDNAAGMTLFRSAAATPAGAGTFTGDKGCKASAHPTTCAGLGGSGLGKATNTRIHDALAATFAGAGYLYLTTGNGAGAVSVYRIAD